MKQLLIAALALLALTPSSHAREGKPDPGAGLKGVKKVFIEAGRDKEDREMILKVLKRNAKKLEGVEVVESLGEAEVWLYYSATKGGSFGPPPSPRAPRDGVGDSTGYNPIIVATANIKVRDARTGEWHEVLRLGSRGSNWPGSPAEKLAKEFVSAWVKANK